MEVLSPATPNGFSKPVEPPDPLAILEHIASLIENTLGAARRELEAVGSLLSQRNYDDSIEQCSRFSTENEVALYAHKDISDDLTVNGHAENGTSGAQICPGN